MRVQPPDVGWRRLPIVVCRLLRRVLRQPSPDQLLGRHLMGEPDRVTVPTAKEEVGLEPCLQRTHDRRARTRRAREAAEHALVQRALIPGAEALAQVVQQQLHRGAVARTQRLEEHPEQASRQGRFGHVPRGPDRPREDARQQRRPQRGAQVRRQRLPRRSQHPLALAGVVGRGSGQRLPGLIRAEPRQHQRPLRAGRVQVGAGQEARVGLAHPGERVISHADQDPEPLPLRRQRRQLLDLSRQQLRLVGLVHGVQHHPHLAHRDRPVAALLPQRADDGPQVALAVTALRVGLACFVRCQTNGRAQGVRKPAAGARGVLEVAPVKEDHHAVVRLGTRTRRTWPARLVRRLGPDADEALHQAAQRAGLAAAGGSLHQQGRLS